MKTFLLRVKNQYFGLPRIIGVYSDFMKMSPFLTFLFHVNYLNNSIHFWFISVKLTKFYTFKLSHKFQKKRKPFELGPKKIGVSTNCQKSFISYFK